MKYILLLILIALTCGCERKSCEGPFPDTEYMAGENAVYKNTGETVRILRKWIPLGGNCHQLESGTYTVRFKDGSEIKAEWSELNKL